MKPASRRHPGAGAETVAQIDDAEGAVRFFVNLARADDEFVAFRGHANDDWQVLPSLFRQWPDIAPYESEIVREIVSLHPDEFSRDTSMLDRLVRMQHFGLPTRLLDVSRNPLVALYFAVDGEDTEDGSVLIFRGSKDRQKYYDSDTVSCISNLANLAEAERITIESSTAKTIRDFNRIHAIERLAQFIRVEKPYFRSRIRRLDLFVPYYVIPKMSNRRLIAQAGAFVLFGLDRTKVDYTRSINISKVIISAAGKPQIRKALEQLGYDSSTLFPDLDRASRQIVKRFSALGGP